MGINSEGMIAFAGKINLKKNGTKITFPFVGYVTPINGFGREFKDEFELFKMHMSLTCRLTCGL